MCNVRRGNPARSSVTRAFATGFLLFTLTSVAHCQHYNWQVVLLDGRELADVHPDSVRRDSLAVSTSNADVCWFHLDSIRSITYKYNPTTLTFAIIGGVIGTTTGLDDPGAGRILIGMASGAAFGYLVAQAMGVSEEIPIAQLDPSHRIEVLRRSVARWSGRVKVISR